MLVEINLLPKKEHKNSSQLIIVLLSMVMVAVSVAVVYWQGHSYENRMEAVDKQIKSIQSLNAAQQAKLTEDESSNSAVKLQAAVQWAEQYPFETVTVLRNVIILLPDRGFIQDFEYSNTNSVVVKVQFDATRDAAFYLSSLKQADWVEEVNILNVVAETKNEETADNTTDINREEARILPRYSAEYEITFRPELFKQNSNVASQGGNES